MGEQKVSTDYDGPIVTKVESGLIFHKPYFFNTMTLKWYFSYRQIWRKLTLSFGVILPCILMKVPSNSGYILQISPLKKYRYLPLDDISSHFQMLSHLLIQWSQTYESIRPFKDKRCLFLTSRQRLYSRALTGQSNPTIIILDCFVWRLFRGLKS